MIRIGIYGYGNLARGVECAIKKNDDMELVVKIDIVGEDTFKSIDEAAKSTKIDVLIDFTQPKSIFENAKYCLNNNIKIVIGTTGLKDDEIEYLKNLSKEKNTGCLIAPNFSRLFYSKDNFSSLARSCSASLFRIANVISQVLSNC